MILTCPACGTKYTVKDGAIPPGGRQVRCANCKHSWHQDPEDGDTAASQAAVAPPTAEPEASDYPAPAADAHPAGEEGGKPPEARLSDHAHPDDAIAEEDHRADPDASPLPEPQASPPESGWHEQREVTAEPQSITGAPSRDEDQREPLPYSVAHDPGLATPPLPAGEETGWVAPAPAAEPVDVDFAAYDRGSEEFSGGRGKALIGLLAAIVLIAAVVLAFWFLAPASFKERLGLAQATDTKLLIQVDQRNRRMLASGNQLLEVSGKVINPTDQTRTVPPLQAQLRSLDQKVVYRWTIPPPAATLQPGGSASFNSAELNIPAAAACLDVSFDKERAPAKPCVPDGVATRAG